jgi:glutamine amidotransferase
VLLEDLLFKPENSLVVQSKHSRLGVETVNGDGFGVGWYGGATTGTAVQQTNCHPFRHGRWLWMHNGGIADFPLLKRDLTLAVEPGLFPDIEGSTDSELFFFLALTFGLQENPPEAVAQAVGLIEETGRRRHGVEYPIQMSVATTDGETTWAFRYSSVGRSRSLFHNTDVATLRLQYPDNPVLHQLSDDARLVVSEPLGDLRGRGGRCRSLPASSSGVAARNCRSSHLRLHHPTWVMRDRPDGSRIPAIHDRRRRNRRWESCA